MKLAIVGMGPRGLSALESLLSKAGSAPDLDMVLFEKSSMAGYGHVYDVDQPASNWVNTSEQGLRTLKGRPAMRIHGVEIPGFPAYAESSYCCTPPDADETFPDVYPARPHMGAYLKERFATLAKALDAADWFRIKREEVVAIKPAGKKLSLETASGGPFIVDEVLLTIGHQPTFHDQQLDTWLKHHLEHPDLILCPKAYPVRSVLSGVEAEKPDIIGMRGFGLSAIDVLRYLATAYGGRFDMAEHHTVAHRYHPGPAPLKVVPFTLDGLPAVPKPLHQAIDRPFAPSTEQLDLLRIQLMIGMEARPDSHHPLLQGVIDLATDRYLDLTDKDNVDPDAVRKAAERWVLHDDVTPDLITDPTLPVLEIMDMQVAMALGNKAPNLDYVIGQVWRHCQPIFNKVFSFCDLPDQVMADIVHTTERIKRYSAGPPVASMQQMVLLARAGVLDLSFMHDPDITLSSEGWTLESDGQSVNTSCMINTVVDPPKLLEVRSPLVRQLLRDDAIRARHETLGIHTKSNGQVLSDRPGTELPLYLLGRLAKGSVIGVDSIVESFGQRIDDWAEECAGRMKSYL